MPGKKQNKGIAWPLAHTNVALNNDGNLLKLIAMVTMFVDHAGKMLFPQYRIMRVIGRLAFPIYCYCLAMGSVYTRNPLKYLKRLVILALISQPIYALGLGHTVSAMYSVSFAENPVVAAFNFYMYSWSKPSIMLTMILGMLLLWTLRERQISLFIALALLCWLIQDKVDYGLKGLGLILLFYLFINYRWLSLAAVLAYMLWWGMSSSGYTIFGVNFGIQTFAILALPFIYIHSNFPLKLPKWVSYFFYPSHLTVIYMICRLT